jgi:acetolactate synthase small subunit
VHVQSNLVKQLGKLVKVRYVEDITKSKRVGEWRVVAVKLSIEWLRRRDYQQSKFS